MRWYYRLTRRFFKEFVWVLRVLSMILGVRMRKSSQSLRRSRSGRSKLRLCSASTSDQQSAQPKVIVNALVQPLYALTIFAVPKFFSVSQGLVSARSVHACGPLLHAHARLCTLGCTLRTLLHACCTLGLAISCIQSWAATAAAIAAGLWRVLSFGRVAARHVPSISVPALWLVRDIFPRILPVNHLEY